MLCAAADWRRARGRQTRKGYQYCWCVDPLDGTKEFIKRNGQFTVNIALLRGDTPILGVVHTPVTARDTVWMPDCRMHVCRTLLPALVRSCGAGSEMLAS